MPSKKVISLPTASCVGQNIALLLLQISLLPWAPTENGKWADYNWHSPSETSLSLLIAVLQILSKALSLLRCYFTQAMCFHLAGGGWGLIFKIKTPFKEQGQGIFIFIQDIESNKKAKIIWKPIMGEYAVFKSLVHNIQSRQLPDSRKDPKLLQGKKKYSHIYPTVKSLMIKTHSKRLFVLVFQSTNECPFCTE